MSLTTALDELRGANSSLAEAVSELVMTVHEDRPLHSEVAVIDNLAEVVSELQASVVQAAAELQDVSDIRQLPNRLPGVDAAIAASGVRYWRDLRSHAAVAELRAAAQRHGVEWRTWQSSLEQSQLRCEEPLLRSAASVRAAWREVGELLSLYLPAADATTAPRAEPTTADANPRPMTTRRPS